MERNLVEFVNQNLVNIDLKTDFASPSDLSTSLLTISSGVDLARWFLLGVLSTINSRFSSKPLASIPSVRNSFPAASMIAGARCVTKSMQVASCDSAASSIPAMIRAPAPGSVIASNSSARISFESVLDTTSASWSKVCSSAPADCVPPAFLQGHE